MLVYQNHSFSLPGDPVNRTCLLLLDAIFELQPLLHLRDRSATKLKEGEKEVLRVRQGESTSPCVLKNGKLDCTTLRKSTKDWCLLSLWQRTL